jgi:ADP-ribose pyrophosphatase YjhB (NUDIX family)
VSPRRERGLEGGLSGQPPTLPVMEPFDYHGALVVVETDAGEIVLIQPPGGPAQAPASLPSDPCAPGEAPQDAAVRMVREMTGLDVVVVREFVTFIQEGTPTGTMCAHGYLARVIGGTLTGDGPAGPARAYPVDGLPAIIPVRVANQRVLAAYLRQREEGGEPPSGSSGSMPGRSSANAEQNLGPDRHNYS